MDRHYLAIDLGAESGRVMLGTLSDGEDPARSRVSLEEIHRFPNGAVPVAGTLRWNVLGLFAAVMEGLKKAAAVQGKGIPISGISTDAWGVDYALLKDGEPLLTLPFHYRDPRTDKAMDKVFGRVPADDIFEATGIQFMPINTLYQLFMDLEDRPETLAHADRFLNIGDYFNYLLSGIPKGEATLASTTQLYDPRRGDWAWDLIARLGLPKRIFPSLAGPGTVLGPLQPGLAAETGLKDVKVVATCSHDTAAAVAAVPAEAGPGRDWAFLSSGTWSLIGAELASPIINAASRAKNFTNEVGYAGTVMFRKNIVGLWIVQECRRFWMDRAEAGKDFDYFTLTALAEKAPAHKSFIRPEDPRFGKPGAMPDKVRAFCRETGQAVPEGEGEIIRCVLESLALLYAKTLRDCAEASGRSFKALHVVGGGSKNKLLNQFTADAVQLLGVEKVAAGPVESTALGNILVQARALGHLAGDLRGAVRRSFPVEAYAPRDREAWKAALGRFERLPLPA
jgi:rhamnulokinase